MELPNDSHTEGVYRNIEKLITDFNKSLHEKPEQIPQFLFPVKERCLSNKEGTERCSHKDNENLTRFLQLTTLSHVCKVGDISTCKTGGLVKFFQTVDHEMELQQRAMKHGKLADSVKKMIKLRVLVEIYLRIQQMRNTMHSQSLI